jgi:hypothetical protein
MGDGVPMAFSWGRTTRPSKAHRSRYAKTRVVEHAAQLGFDEAWSGTRAPRSPRSSGRVRTRRLLNIKRFDLALVVEQRGCRLGPRLLIEAQVGVRPLESADGQPSLAST